MERKKRSGGEKRDERRVLVKKGGAKVAVSCERERERGSIPSRRQGRAFPTGAHLAEEKAQRARRKGQGEGICGRLLLLACGRTPLARARTLDAPLLNES